MKKVTSVILAIVMLASFVALSGCAKQGDKDFDKWMNDNDSIVQTLGETTVDVNDLESAEKALTDELTKISTLISGLQKLDKSGMSTKYAEDYDKILSSLTTAQAGVQGELDKVYELMEAAGALEDEDGMSEDGEDEEDGDYDQEEDAWFGIGEDESGNVVTFAANADMSQVVLVLTNNDQGVAAQFIGSAVVDEDGTMTITDAATGNEFVCIIVDQTDEYLILEAADDGTTTEINAVDQAEYEATNSQIGEEFEPAF